MHTHPSRALARLMSAALLAVAAAGTGTTHATAAGTTYYVDCTSTATPDGSVTAPWNSLSTVNATTFGPGDQVLLKRGTSCTGQLVGHGSGTAGSPITIGAYGSGVKPVVAGAGQVPDTVLLKDVSHWTVRDLRVTNAGTQATRTGIKVHTSSTTAKAGITITGNEVDHVAGWSNKTGTQAGWFAASAGIMVLADLNTAGAIDGVTITDNYVHDTGGGGIKIRNKPAQYHSNVLIARNRLISIGGDGIVVHGSDAPLVEYNRFDDGGGGAYPFTGGNYAGMWPINSRNPVFQFNEVTRSAPSIYDSTAWDCDGGIVGTCTYQYNFSANNAGGFFLGCQACTEFPNYNAKQIVRYNVSQDDCRIKAGSDKAPTEMYNNTFYCSSKAFDVSLPNGTGASTLVANNIFVSPQGSLPVAAGITYSRNLYWGGFTAPTGDAGAVTADPRLSFPGGSAAGYNGLQAYRVATGSPAVGAGQAVAGNGGRDLFGAAVPGTGAVNIGADNGTAVPGPHVYASLREAFNNTGITKDANPSIGGLSLSGRSLSGQALATAGFASPSVTTNGTTFAWPQQYFGFPDNVKVAGQKVAVTGSGPSLAFVGLSVSGTTSGSGTVHYTDGTTSAYTLTFADWWSTTAAPGTSLATTMSHHNKKATTYNDAATGRDEQDVRLWYSAVPITAGKTVSHVTLPAGSPLATAGLHVFAMTVT